MWTKVDVLTSYQRITAEIQIRGRLRETMNDAEPLFHLRNVSAEPLLPGAVQLNGVPEGLFNKARWPLCFDVATRHAALFQVLLVVVLGGEERDCGDDLRDYRFGVAAGFLQ